MVQLLVMELNWIELYILLNMTIPIGDEGRIHHNEEELLDRSCWMMFIIMRDNIIVIDVELNIDGS